MIWLEAAATALCVLGLFWLPGLLVARAWGVPATRLATVALAPVLTAGIAGVGAILLAWAGVRWNVASFAGLTVVACGWPVLRRRRLPRLRRSTSLSEVDYRLVAACLLGIALQAVPVMIGMLDPRNIVTADDAVGHFNSLRLIRVTGSGSSLDISAVNTLTDVGHGFDGAAWHAVTTLAPAYPDLSVLFNMSIVIMSTVTWTLGIADLTSMTFPHRPPVVRWAAVLSGAGMSLPLYLAFNGGGEIPNAVGVAMFPAVVACVFRLIRNRSVDAALVAGLACAGIALVHPNAFFSVALAITPALAAAWWRRFRRPTSAAGKVVAALPALAAGLVVVLVATSQRLTGVLRYGSDPPLPPWQALRTFLSGDVSGYGWAGAYILVVASISGLVLARRAPRARPALWGAATLTAFYFVTSSSIPVLTELDRPWYGEARRYAAPLVAMLLPFGARSLQAAPGWITRALRRRGRRAPSHTFVALVCGAVVGAFALPTLLHLGTATRSLYVGHGSQTIVNVGGELALLHRLRGELEPDLGVLGSPLAGGAHLYGLSGQRVVPRSAFPDDSYLQDYAFAHIGELGTNPALCRVLRELGVGYLYVDPYPWGTSDWSVEGAPARGVKLVDRGGFASVYRIVGCSTV